MPGSARSTSSSSSTAMASSAEPCSDDAIGSSVNSRFSQAPAMVSSPSRLVVTRSMPSLTRPWAVAASSLACVDRLAQAGDQVAHDVGVVLQEAGGRDEVGRHELAVGPQLGLVEQDVPAALEHEARRPRLGDPGAVEVARLQRGQRVGVVLGRDPHVAAAGGVGLVALLGQPGPEGDVLGVAERRRRERGPGEVLGRVDALAHDERGAARRRAGDDAERPRRRTASTR